jgi:hypothetical protein
MAYFNHAFNKTFVGTTGFVQNDAPTSGLAKGEFSFYNPKTWSQATDARDCCPLVLVSGSIHEGKDKIGPYHGGYAESVKSKTINAKYVSSFYKVLPCAPQQAQIVVGSTANNLGGTCQKDFLCGETYNLRVDIKGSPVLRTLTRNTYYTAAAYTGCCDEDAIAPVAVNPLIVYVQWAYQLLNSPLINPFIQVAITYTIDNGLSWSEIGDGTSSQSNLNDLLNYIQNPASLPVVDPTAATEGAGIIINGAYVDTRLGDCTFYPNDSIIAFLEPVKIYASEVDLNGDPCAFAGICVNDTCDPIQLKGTGENIIRDLILTEGYMQQPFYTGTDLRIREITNGTDVYDTISRTSYYTRYYIQHNVPRFNNPTGVFDNDQYLLEIVGAPEMTTTMVGSTSYNAGTDTTTFDVLDATGAYIGGSVDIDDDDDTATITAINGTTITVSGEYTYEDVAIIFYDQSLWNFEDFFVDWLRTCNSNCAEMVTYDCPGTCNPIEAVVNPVD